MNCAVDFWNNFSRGICTVVVDSNSNSNSNDNNSITNNNNIDDDEDEDDVEENDEGSALTLKKVKKYLFLRDFVQR